MVRSHTISAHRSPSSFTDDYLSISFEKQIVIVLGGSCLLLGVAFVSMCISILFRCSKRQKSQSQDQESKPCCREQYRPQQLPAKQHKRPISKPTITEPQPSHNLNLPSRQSRASVGRPKSSTSLLDTAWITAIPRVSPFEPEKILDSAFRSSYLKKLAPSTQNEDHSRNPLGSNPHLPVFDSFARGDRDVSQVRRTRRKG